MERKPNTQKMGSVTKRHLKALINELQPTDGPSVPGLVNETDGQLFSGSLSSKSNQNQTDAISLISGSNATKKKGDTKIYLSSEEESKLKKLKK